MILLTALLAAQVQARDRFDEVAPWRASASDDAVDDLLPIAYIPAHIVWRRHGD